MRAALARSPLVKREKYKRESHWTRHYSLIASEKRSNFHLRISFGVKLNTSINANAPVDCKLNLRLPPLLHSFSVLIDFSFGKTSFSMAMAIRSVMLDTRQSPCLCVEAVAHQNLNVKAKGNRIPKSRNSSSLELSSSFMGNWNGRGPLVRSKRRNSKRRGMVVVDELGGTYEEGFEDVHLNLMNFFTYKAVRTVLTQLYEMNPPSYRWFYNFVASNNPKDGKYFLRALGKERQELAERVMITRLHLYGKWIKKCDHARMYQKISDENLELMRERLMETVIWPSDDTNTNSEKIG